MRVCVGVWEGGEIGTNGEVGLGVGGGRMVVREGWVLGFGGVAVRWSCSVRFRRRGLNERGGC